MNYRDSSRSGGCSIGCLDPVPPHDWRISRQARCWTDHWSQQLRGTSSAKIEYVPTRKHSQNIPVVRGVLYSLCQSKDALKILDVTHCIWNSSKIQHANNSSSSSSSGGSTCDWALVWSYVYRQRSARISSLPYSLGNTANSCSTADL